MRKILSLDGGGIRGIVPARILAWFESKLGPVSSWADLIVGTSTGGILAAGLAHTTDGKTPTYSADALLGLYRDHGAEIFHRTWRDKLDVLEGAVEPIFKYGHAGIETVLQKYYGTVRLSSALIPTVITAFDELKWQAKMFKSEKAKVNAAEDLPLWYAARATSAAPTYFPPIDGLVDGGVAGATNPAMVAFIESLMMWPSEPIFLLSIGTGKKDGSVNPEKHAPFGLGEINYIRAIVDMLLDGPERAIEKAIEELIPPERRARVQGELIGKIPSHAMDDASAGNIEALIAFADKIIADNQDFLNGTVATISRGATNK